ncbi:MAG: D-glycerate dehydrogenase [Anaerolinea sp.]|nr:D-glycerate dehydrogenase [Anaerolinea sp.]
MARIFVTRTPPGTAIATLRAHGHQVSVWPGELPPSREALAAALAEADAALTMVTDRIDEELLAGAPSLRIIANMAVGYDNVDPATAARAGVWLTNTPGVLAETTADMAFALLMAAARNVVASDRDSRAGGWKTWSPTAFLGQDVHGATLGIVGLGEIGQAVALRATGFKMRVVYTGRTRKPDAERVTGAEWLPLDALLRASDFVSVHTPLTPETHHLMDASRFATMKRGAIVINTARGQVVDQDALVAALSSGHLGGAALDVTDPEPLPLTHPLYGFPNVIITPHIASASMATRSKMAEMAAANILAVLASREPPNPVNRPAHSGEGRTIGT